MEQTFGQWLREKRLDRGLTLQEFADLCELSYVTISTVELDKVNAGINAMKKIAKALNMEYIELRNIAKQKGE